MEFDTGVFSYHFVIFPLYDVSAAHLKRIQFDQEGRISTEYEANIKRTLCLTFTNTLFASRNVASEIIRLRNNLHMLLLNTRPTKYG